MNALAIYVHAVVQCAFTVQYVGDTDRRTYSFCICPPLVLPSLLSFVADADCQYLKLEILGIKPHL